MSNSTDRELVQNQDIYGHLFQNLGQAVFLVDIKTGLIIDTNLQGMTLLGKARDEIVSMYQKELFPLGKARKYRRILATHVENGHTVSYETEVIRKDGRVIPVIVDTSNMSINERELAIVVFHDITKRRQLEHDLAKRLKELECPNSIAAITEKSNFTLGKLYQEVVDLLPRCLQYPDIACARLTIGGKILKTNNYRANEGKKYFAVETNGTKIGTIEISYLEKEGGIGKMPFLKEEIKLISTIASQLADITQRKPLEKKLEESERRFKHLAQSLPQLIFETDRKGNITFANRRAQSFLGYTQKDFDKGMTIFQLLSAKDRDVARDRFERLLKRENLSPIEYKALRKDGSTFPIVALPRAIVRDRNTVPITWRTRDFDTRFSLGAVNVTGLTRTKHSMQSYIKEITRAQEEERKHIARQLHDETAQSLADLSRQIGDIILEDKQLPEDTTIKLEKLRNETNEVLKGLRHFSQTLRPEILDHLGLVPTLESMTKQMSEGGKINVTLEVSGSEQRLPSETELVLFRVVQEALRNVKKHSQATDAEVRVEFVPERVKVSVTDYGKGFEVPEVFADLVGSGKLGLLTMTERAHLVNGKLSVESQRGKGTVLSLEVVV